MNYCIRAKVHGIICFGFGVSMREGNWEYFYQKLDRHFPGMKQRYIQNFGNSYECNSPNNTQLMELFRNEYRKHGILCNPNDVFAYLHKFEIKERQLALFEMGE